MNIFYLSLKAIITGAVVIAISEFAKKSTLTGAITASLPITSIFAMLWLYSDTQNLESIQKLSWGIFWLVIPSLSFFILLPVSIKFGLQFFPALMTSSAGTFLIYLAYTKALGLFGISL